MNFLRFIWVLSWRNLWRSKRRTLITVSSIIFAVMLAVVMESITLGQHEQIIGNMVKLSTGYMQYQDSLYANERSLDNSFELSEQMLKDIDKQLSPESYYIPRLESFALVASTQNARAAMITGVDFEKEQKLNSLQNKLIAGEIPASDAMEILIPEGIAKRFAIGPGDTLVVYGSGFQGMQAAGKFAISGIVKFPLAQQNDMMVYLPLEASQWLFVAENRLTSLLLMADSENELKKDQTALSAIGKDYGLKLIPWEEINPDLVNALEMDKASGKIMILILYVVIAFGIFGTILTMTLERQKEFGSMLSLGMRRGKLALVTLIETIQLCILGIVGGLIVGIPITYYFHYNPIPLGGDIAQTVEQFGMEALLVFSTQTELYVNQAITVFFIAFLVASYPIWWIFKLDILKTIRT